jgi:hypothetical protein
VNPGYPWYGSPFFTPQLYGDLEIVRIKAVQAEVYIQRPAGLDGGRSGMNSANIFDRNLLVFCP